MPEGLWRASRAAPSGVRPPLGHSQDNLDPRSPASTPRLGRRSCLRQGCGHIYQARRWNQRYCGQADCRLQLRRWQAAKRQQRRRSRPEVRQQHAAAERQRRAHRGEATNSAVRSRGQDAAGTPDGAWSRSKRNLAPFCDRPGCYQPRRQPTRSPARYCGDACARAMRRVQDRERKWLRRNTLVGRLKRRLEYASRRSRRKNFRRHPGQASEQPSAALSQAVLNYREPEAERVSCRDVPEARCDDQEKTTDARSRPPPS